MKNSLYSYKVKDAQRLQFSTKWKEQKAHCIAVMADNHIGIPKGYNVLGERTDYICRATIKLADAMSEYASTLAIAGDFLDKRRFVEAGIIDKAKQVMHDILIKYRKVYLLVGNHEYTGTEFTVLDMFKEAILDECGNRRLVIIHKPTSIMHDKVMLFPFMGSDYAHITEEYKDRISHYQYLIGHWPLVGAEINGGKLEKGLPIDLFSGRITILGDVHKAQTIRRIDKTDEDVPSKYIAYVGAPIQHNFGEEGNPCGGIVLNTYAQTREAVRIEIEPEFSFHTIDIVNLSEVPDVVKSLETKRAYKIVCETPEIRSEVERLVPPSIACTTVLNQVTKSEVRLKSVLNRQPLDAICSEYLREVRNDIAQETYSSVLQKFSTVREAVSGLAE